MTSVRQENGAGTAETSIKIRSRKIGVGILGGRLRLYCMRPLVLPPPCTEAPSRMVRRFRTLLVVCVLASTLNAADSAARSFDISAGPAEQALKAFSAQSGQEVLFATATTSRVRTNLVKGTYSPADALDRLLKGTGLVATRDPASGILSITRDPNGSRAAPTTVRSLRPPQDASEDQAVVLSPFEVTTNKDVGYQAGNTASGSRLNSRLKDTAASVMVFNSDFLADFAASTLAESVAYAPNLQVDAGDTTADATVGGAGTGLPQARIRVRGLFAGVALDYFDSNLAIDTYNTERVDLSSGPNSILFGFAATGGLVNFATKRAEVNRNRTASRLQVGEFDFRRFELDHNQVVIPGKLSFRLNGLRQNSGGWRQWDFSNIDRGAAAAKANLGKSTTVNVSYENGHTTSHPSWQGNAYDTLKLWQLRGAQLKSDAAWNTADRAAGINRNTAVRAIFVTDGDGSKPFVLTTANAANFRLLESTFEDLNVPAADRVGSTYVPASSIPFSISTSGPGAVKDDNFDRVVGTLTHIFSRSLSFEASYRREQIKAWVFLPIVTSPGFYGDPNTVIPDPNGGNTPIHNPNAGGHYLESRWVTGRQKDWREGGRAVLAGEIELGRFGRHQLAAMVEHDRVRTCSYPGVEILVDENGVPIGNAAAPENTANFLWRRHYVVPGQFETYLPGDGRQNFTVRRNGKTYHNTWVDSNVAQGDIRRTIDSAQLVARSAFFDSKLMFTGGVRSDRVRFDQTGSTRLSANNPDVLAGRAVMNQLRYTSSIETTTIYQPVTSTLGAVAHVTPWLSAFYNRADNNSQPSGNTRILPDETLPPPPGGAGQDYGVMLNLFDGRLFVRATAFRTVQTKAGTFNIRGGDGDIVAPTQRILDTLLANNRITTIDYTNHLLGDSGSNLVGLGDTIVNGFETSAWLNLTRNLTAILNFSQTKVDRSRIVPEFEGWFEREWAFWHRTPGAGGLVNPVSNSTVDEEAAQMKTNIKDLRDLNNISLGERPYKANVSGRYTFMSGMFKGIFVGGGARWQSKAKLGRQVLGRNAKGSAIYGETYYGPDDFKVDGFVGYRRKMVVGRIRPELTLQLNVTNLSDEDSVAPLRYNADKSGYRRVMLFEPRKVRLTAGFEL